MDFNNERNKHNFRAIVCGDGNDLYNVVFHKLEDKIEVQKYDCLSIEKPFKIVGCCLGYICFSSDNLVYLWNPEDQITKRIEVFGKEAETSSFGFGFNDLDKNFEIMRIWTTPECDFHSYMSVYSISYKSWIKLPPIYYKVSSSGGKFLNSNLHWPADSEGLGWSNRVIAYNLRKRKLQEVPLPDVDQNTWSNYVVCGVGNFNQYLSVALRSEDHRTLGVWVMMEYGRKESWTMIVNISDSINDAHHIYWAQIVPLFVMSKSCELALCDKSGLYVYNAKDLHLLSKVQIREITQDSLEAVAYTETEFIPNYSPTSNRKRKWHLDDAKRTPKSEPTKKRERKSGNGSKGTITEVDPLNENAEMKESEGKDKDAKEAALGAKEEKGGSIIEGGASKEEDGFAKPSEELTKHVDVKKKEAESKRKNAPEITGDVLAGETKERDSVMESEKTAAKKEGKIESAFSEDSKVGNVESASAALGTKEEKGGSIIEGEASKEEVGSAEPAEELAMHVDAENKEIRIQAPAKKEGSLESASAEDSKVGQEAFLKKWRMAESLKDK